MFCRANSKSKIVQCALEEVIDICLYPSIRALTAFSFFPFFRSNNPINVDSFHKVQNLNFVILAEIKIEFKQYIGYWNCLPECSRLLLTSVMSNEHAITPHPPHFISGYRLLK